MNEEHFGCFAAAIAVLVVVIVVCWNVFKNNIYGNKQFIDLKTDFNVAYVLGDDGKFERKRIKAWNDWKDSDAVQVVLEDGTAIYTHLRNVKLTKELR